MTKVIYLCLNHLGIAIHIQIKPSAKVRKQHVEKWQASRILVPDLHAVDRDKVNSEQLK